MSRSLTATEKAFLDDVRSNLGSLQGNSLLMMRDNAMMLLKQRKKYRRRINFCRDQLYPHASRSLFRFGDRVNVKDKCSACYVVCETNLYAVDLEPMVQVWSPESNSPSCHYRYQVDLTSSEQLARKHRRFWLDPSKGPDFKFEVDSWTRLMRMSRGRPRGRVTSWQMALVIDRVRVPTTPLTNWYRVDYVYPSSPHLESPYVHRYKRWVSESIMLPVDIFGRPLIDGEPQV